MNVILSTIRKIPIIAKAIIALLFPIGTIAMFVYAYLDATITYRNVETKTMNNPTEESVRYYLDFLKTKHLLIGLGDDKYNRIRMLVANVCSSETVSNDTKKELVNILTIRNMYKKDGSNSSVKFRASGGPSKAQMQSIIDQQNAQWAMEESIKGVTPADQGGYLHGPGVNPSDTMMNNNGMF